MAVHVNEASLSQYSFFVCLVYFVVKALHILKASPGNSETTLERALAKSRSLLQNYLCKRVTKLLSSVRPIPP